MINRVIVLWVILAWLEAAQALQAKKERPEYEVKAAGIKLVSSLIKWPDKAFEKANSPFRIGLVGKDHFNGYLDKLQGKIVWGREIVLTKVADASKVEDLKGCHVVFVSESEDESLGDILKAFKNRPTLLMGDKKGFGARGVGINFFLADDTTLRFELNTEAAEAAGLTLTNEVIKVGDPPK